MWEKLFGFIGAVIKLNETLKKNQADIEKLQAQQIEVSITLKIVLEQLKSNKELEKAEREKLILAIENELLRFEKQLPPK